MTIRVLICRSNPIDPDPRVEKIAHALSASGYQVSILGWDRTGNLPQNTFLGEQTSPIHLYRLPIRSQYGHGLANLPNLLRWQASLMKWLKTRHDEYDVIHACDFDTILPALIAQKMWGEVVIYDIFDFYADHLRATPNVIKSLIRSIDLRAIDQADALILADDSRWEQIKGAHPKRSTVIYNTPDENTISVNVHPEANSTSSLKLAYVGLLQVERGLVEVLDILHKHPEWSLDLAGFGGDEDLLSNMAKDMPNVQWYGRVSYEKALQLSMTADVLFATYDPSIPNHRFSSPNKVFEAMMLGKPIIVARNTNMDRIIEDADCGIVVPYGDSSKLEEALNILQSDPVLRQRFGKNARKAYETTYSWSKMTQRLLSLYKDVLSTRQ